jgi:hypothetical protein
LGDANPMVSLRNSCRPLPRRLAFTTSGRTDWTDGPKKILSVGDAAPVRDLEPELQFGVFNRMHVPV